MGVIAALLPNGAWLHRLRVAVRDRHEVVACTDWTSLLRTCETEPVYLAVFDLYADSTLNLEHLRTLRRRYPRVTQVAYVVAAAERGRDLFDAGRAGIDGLVLAERDDGPGVLRAIVELAEARSVAGIVRENLADLKPMIRDALLIAVTRAHKDMGPDDLGRLLAVSRRSLADQLAQANFPPPQRLLAWGRLIVAAHMLEDESRSADSIALALDYPSGSAFRNTCQRYLSATPHEIRARGGARFAIAGLLGEVARNDRTAEPAAEPATETGAEAGAEP